MPVGALGRLRLAAPPWVTLPMLVFTWPFWLITILTDGATGQARANETQHRPDDPRRFATCNYVHIDRATTQEHNLAQDFGRICLFSGARSLISALGIACSEKVLPKCQFLAVFSAVPIGLVLPAQASGEHGQYNPSEVSHEANRYRGVDVMCVLRVRGMGPAANMPGPHPMGPVPKVRHDALEPVRQGA